MSAYDQLLKDLGIAFSADLVRLIQPDLADHLDLEAVRFRADEGFTDTPRGRRRHPDLVAETRGSILHVEIERAYRVATRERLIDYNRMLALRRGAVVHTAVLYLHGGPAGLHRAVYPEGTHGQVSAYFCYNLLGVERAPAEEYLARSEPLAWALAALMTPTVLRGRAELAVECMRRVAVAGLDEARQFLLLDCIASHGVESSPDVAREHRRLLRERRNSEVREMFMTYSEKMKLKLEKELRGSIEDEVRARLEPVLRREIRDELNLAKEPRESVRDLVLRQIAQRFGDLPDALRRRVEAMGSGELFDLGERLVRAHSVDELALA